jgi:DNA-binding HxlR family transcriptional regulator
MSEQPVQSFCAIHSAQHVIGGKWTLVTIWHLREGRMRFGELERAIGEVSQKALTECLKHIEHAGLVTRTVHAEVPLRVEYELTPFGRTLLPIVEALTTWAERHQADIQNHSTRTVAL